MSFRSEIQPGTKLLLGLTESGQGKATGAATVLPHLGDVPILRPSDGALPTRLIWQIAGRQYERNGIPGAHQAAYDAKRAAGVPEWKIQAANYELVRALADSDAHLLSMHGIFGYGADRTVVEIDRKVETTIAVAGTHALVPLPETADELLAIGREKGVQQDIDVIGFLVPDALKDPVRKQQRIETLSQKEPSRDNPLRLAFMTTGQFGHQDVLRNQILGDERVKRWIKDGRMTMDIYLWNSPDKATDVQQFAAALDLPVTVTRDYQKEPGQGVQIFYNEDPLTAVEGSIDMAARADIVVSPIAERVGWTLEVPFIALPPVGANAKMLSNMDWTTNYGLTTLLSEGQMIGDILPEFFGTGASNIQRHYDQADLAKTQFRYGDLTGAGARAAEIVFDRLKI